MATQISRAKRLVKMLKRLVKQPYLYDEEQNKLIREQLEVAKNELASCLLYTSPSPRDCT